MTNQSQSNSDLSQDSRSEDNDFKEVVQSESIAADSTELVTNLNDHNDNNTQDSVSMTEDTPIIKKPKREIFNLKHRKWFLLWLYAVAIGHFLVGFLLATQSDHPLINFYHQSVERFFWQGEVPEMARSQQIWWMSLFGATLQYLAILIGVLIYLGQRYKSRLVWFSLIVAFLIWLPQDCWISFQAQQYIHIVINLFAALCMLFPLFALIKIDKRKAQF